MPCISVHVDESGDIGFGQNSSKFFSVGYVIADTGSLLRKQSDLKQLLEKINFKAKHKNKISEFKFSSDPHRVKNEVLCYIQKSNLTIYVINIKKDSVKPCIRKNSLIFYRWAVIDNIVELLVNKCMDPSDPNNSINFIIDRSLKKNRIESFDKYYQNQILAASIKRDPMMHIGRTITHELSQNNLLLQIADYAAGAVQRKMERNDSKYYDIISSKVKYWQA